MVCHDKKQSQLKQRRNKLICSRKDARQLWKILKEGNASRRQNETGISSDEWFNYFKNLLNMRNDSTGSENVVLFSDDRQVLDSRQLNIHINAAEIIESINHLHANKSPGPDGICMEMYKCIIDISLPFLTKLVDEIYESGVFPDEWDLSIIAPLHKKAL